MSCQLLTCFNKNELNSEKFLQKSLFFKVFIIQSNSAKTIKKASQYFYQNYLEIANLVLSNQR